MAEESGDALTQWLLLGCRASHRVILLVRLHL